MIRVSGGMGTSVLLEKNLKNWLLAVHDIFVTSWSPYSAPCASLRFSWNVLVLEYEGKLPPLVTFSDSSPVDKQTGNKKVFSAEWWDEKRKMSRWLETLRKVHQKNKLTTATAFFYKLQKDSSISNISTVQILFL